MLSRSLTDDVSVIRTTMRSFCLIPPGLTGSRSGREFAAYLEVLIFDLHRTVRTDPFGHEGVIDSPLPFIAIVTFLPKGSMSILRFPPLYAYSFPPTETFPSTFVAVACGRLPEGKERERVILGAAHQSLW